MVSRFMLGVEDWFRSRAEESGFKVQGSGFRVQGSGFKMYRSTGFRISDVEIDEIQGKRCRDR
jgi:uncharacterized protein YxjI